MKKIAFIIAILFLVKPVLPVIDYAINYRYIATVLCENKAKPELKCNGKCHLMKELAKQSENEKPISNDKKNSLIQETEVLFFQTEIAYNLSNPFGRNKTNINSFYLDMYTYLNSYSIFHPPILI